MQTIGPPTGAVFLCSKTGRDIMFKTIKRILVAMIAAALLAVPVMADTAQQEGIDVSHYDEAVDFAQVKASGRSFAYIKATDGYGTQDAAGGLRDTWYSRNSQSATAAGIAWGPYHFFRVYSVASAQYQAELFWSTIQGTGYTLTPVVDIETADGHQLATDVRAILQAFCDRFRELSGEDPVIYSYTSYINEYGLAKQFGSYILWQADYRSQRGNTGWDAAVWQYTDSGSVPGCTAPSVDLDRLYDASVYMPGTATVAPAPVQPAADPIVLAHQQALNRLHIRDFAGNALAEDGIAGDHTDQAIRNLQTVCGISVDGQWGPQTDAAIQSIIDKPMLRRGSTGIPVRYIQSQIGGVDMDGDFGPATEAHVCGWQANCGMSVDGIFGPQCWGKMIG